MPRNAGDLLAWRYEDISICVRERIVRRRQLSRELVGGIDESVIGVDEVLSRLVVGTRFQPLAACKGNVLEHASALDDARDLNNVVLAIGMEQPELPVAATATGIDVSTEPGLNGFRNHLLQRRIGHKEPLQQTRLLGV